MNLHVIFYAAVKNRRETRILNQIEAVMPTESIMICRSTQELSRYLMRPLNEVLAVVLLVADKEDLAEILSLRDVLHETRVILLLPDSENETTVKAHRLRPRLLTFADDDSGAVAAVLGRIMRKVREEEDLKAGTKATNRQNAGARDVAPAGDSLQ
jgi:hypothetical protein